MTKITLSLSTQVDTTTGVVLCTPNPMPYGPVVPAGTVREQAVPALPHLPLQVPPSPLLLQGPSMATVSVVLEGWSVEAFGSVGPGHPRHRAVTSTVPIQMRRSLSSHLLL